MARLLTHPDIDWRADGTPVARAFGDVYFSTGDGLAETRTVFLKGCGLPEAWTGRRQFTIAETGFGTGLNFLALWQLWRSARPAPVARLSFVSFEAFPLRQEDARRALAAWPELGELAEHLLERWPGPARGVRHLRFPEDGIELILHLGDIAETLPRSRFRADAWFLDGFSPANNGAMWTEALFPQIAARSAPGARLATFTVAGGVRRALSAAGFGVAKAEGHGRKRERLEAVFPAEKTTGPRPAATGRVAVLGAGIAGAAIAARLRAAELDVCVYDPASEIAAGASGNPLALLMPRLDAGDTVEARLLIDAYLEARGTYRGLPGSEETSVRQMPRNETERRRFEKVLADPPLPLEDLEALSGGGLLHKRAMILRPRHIVGALLGDAPLRLGMLVTADLQARTVNGQKFDAIVLASGMALRSCLPGVDLTGRQGQVEHLIDAVSAPASADAAGAYALCLDTERLWGATFEPADELGGAAISAEARQENLAGLEALSPWWVSEARRGAAVSRASVRATTPDRLPLVGSAPDAGGVKTQYTENQGLASWPVLPGVYVAGGYGSRGFTWAPWAAGVIAADLSGSPMPAGEDLLGAVDPVRQILRRLRRG
jgi:tRNA 5-methylaminomethyl-2-thiouridine biosynthesis bifunctional protein